MRHAWGYATDKRLREENEDSVGVFALSGFTLLVVCDGMGGHAGGRQASSLAVRVIYEQMCERGGEPLPKALEGAIAAANLEIFEASRKSRKLMGMGTTAVVLAIQGRTAYVAHVGDSRGYMIRDGQAVQLTRDHTMVNLFVDAELLSPEDAASHPEAHVLARSLGVERTVEVDVGAPIELRDGDAFLLCSDGVHGIVTDWEIAKLEWSNPHETARNVLWTVRDRDGDDNATVAAAAIGADPSLSPPETEVPAGLQFRDPSSASPGTRTVPGLAPPQLLVPDASIRPSNLDVAKTADPGSRTVDAAGRPAPKPDAKAAADKKRPKKGTSTARVWMVAIGSTVGTGSLLLGALVIGGRAQRPPVDQEPRRAEVEVTTSGPATTPASAVEPAAAPEVTAGDDPPQVAPSAALPENTPWLFAPNVPPPPAREPHRPKKFMGSPPGGSRQLEAVTSARAKECARSLDTVRAAMKTSPDFASLYPQAWECFNSVHQQVVVRANVGTWQEFTPYIDHFQGPTADTSRPFWHRPATDGLEYRLQAFIGSNTEDQFAAAMLDFYGPGKVADQLGTDVLVEAQAAAGFALRGLSDAPAVQWWARRVYYAGRTLESPIGDILQEHRPDLADQTAQLLDQATYGAWSDPTMIHGLPREVRDALNAARGAPMSAPGISDAHQRLAPVVAPIEPPEAPAEPEFVMPRVYRQGDRN